MRKKPVYCVDCLYFKDRKDDYARCESPGLISETSKEWVDDWSRKRGLLNWRDIPSLCSFYKKFPEYIKKWKKRLV